MGRGVGDDWGWGGAIGRGGIWGVSFRPVKKRTHLIFSLL